MALEPRMMFDGAAADAVIKVVHAQPEVAHDATPAHEAAKTLSNQSTASDTVVPDRTFTPVATRYVDPKLNNGKKEVIFIDTSVDNYQILVNGVRTGVEVILIDGSASGLAQLAQWAETHSGYDAIHVLSHGTKAMLRLGKDVLTNASLQSTEVQAKLAILGQALIESGDLLVYGCGVASGTEGQTFIEHLAMATGADIAASVDTTGSESRGGNWTLEANTGPTEIYNIIYNENINYDNTLGLVNGGSTGTVTFDASVVTWHAGATSGMTSGQIISSANILSTGFDIYAKNSTGTSFRIGSAPSGVTGSTSATTGYVRINGNVALTSASGAYMEFRANSGIFDLDSLWMGSGDSSTYPRTYSVQALNSSWTPTGTAVTQTISATATFYQLSVASNTDFDGIYGFRITTDAGTILAVDDVAVTNPRNVATNTAPTFVGATTTLSISQNATATDIKSLLHASDSDSSQTETWSQSAAPSHGTLSFSSATATSGSTDITPGGTITYTPTAGYAGSDSFTVQVSDGTASATRTITVSITPTTPGTPDLTAGTDNGSSSTDNSTNATSLNFTGTSASSDSSSTVLLFLDKNANGSFDSGTDPTATATVSNGSWSVSGLSTSGVNDGTYNVYAQVTSATGSLTSALSSTLSVTLDSTAPTVSSVSSSSNNGSYKSGDVVAVSITFSEAVTVDTSSGTPYLTMETGTTDRNATYASGSGSNTLTFNYTVQAGDSSSDLDYTATTALNLNNGTIKDAAGNNATLTLASPSVANSLSANKAIIIDGVAPTVSSVSSSTNNNTYKAGDVIAVTVAFSEAVTVVTTGGTPYLTLETGTTDRNATYASGSGSTTLTFNYTVQAGDSSSDLDYTATSALALNGGTIKDAAGNDATLILASPAAANSLGNNKAIVIDTTAPTVSSVSSSTANGSYSTGESINITVNFSEAVTVTGTPQITLETGSTDRTVNYVSGSGSTALLFTYTVQSGDNTTDLDYTSTSALTLNGGTISDAVGNSATLTLATPGAANSLAANKNIAVIQVPTVTAVTASTANGSFKAGDTIDVTVTFSEAVNVNTSSGTPYITLETGSTDRNANYVSGSGGTTLTFRYTVQAGDNSSDLDYVATTSLSANSGTIQNGSGSNASLTLATPGAANSLGNNKAIIIDTIAPTISAVSATTANGSYKAGDTVDVTVTFSEAVTVTGTPQITLETGSTDRTVNYSSGSGSSTLTFTYTVQAGDNTSDLDYTATTALALNSGTIKDGAGNDATLTLASPGAANSLGNNKAILIDTTAPTISSVSASSANGSYKAGDTVTVTVTFSEAVNVSTTGGTPSITLETGSTDRNATYASGTGSNTLTFTYTVQAGDSTSDLDYTTTSALAVNGGTIKDAVGNDATLTLASPGAANSLGDNKAIVIDTTAPSVSSVSATTADGSYKVGDVIAVTVTFSEAVSVVTTGGTPTLTLETGTTDRNASFVSGSGSDTLTFHYTVQAGDSTSDLDYTATTALALNGGTIKDAAGNNATLTLATPGAANSLGNNKAILIDTAAPTVSSVSSSTANGTYYAGQSINVTVNFSEAVTVTGTPQITLETGSTDRTVNYVSGSGSAALLFTYTVQSGDITSDLDYSSSTALALNSGSIKDSAGNDATLTLAAPGAANSLGNAKNIIVALAPSVSSVSASSADGSYKAGDTINVTVTFTEAITVTGTPYLTLETGTNDRNATYSSGSGSTTLTFAYSVQAGDSTTDLDYVATTSLNANGGTLQNGSAVDAVLTLATPGAANSLSNNKAIIIDTSAPTISAVSATTANGSYKAGDTVDVTVTFSEAVTVTGTPQITLETGSTDRTVNYGSGSGSSTLTFTYTVQAGDSSSDLDYTTTSALNLNGGTIKDGAGNDATLTLAAPGTANSLGNNKAILIDTTAPTVSSVTSTSADGRYKSGDTINVTIHFSEAVTVATTGGTPYITLETGSSDRNALYSSGSGTSALVFTYTVQAGDSTSDLDYVGSSALALNGGTIQDAAGNSATLTLAATGSSGSLANGKALVVDTTVETPSVATPTINEDSDSGAIAITRSSNDGNELAYYQISGISGGTLYSDASFSSAISNGDFIASGGATTNLYFRPTSNRNSTTGGNGSFTVQAATGNGSSYLGGSTATSTITLTPIADTPTVASPTINEDTDSGAIAISRAAGDGSETSYYKITSISGGSLYSDSSYSTAINNGDFIASAGATTNLYFRPTANHNSTTGGNGAFTVQAATGNSNADLGGATVTSTITLSPVADTPSITDAFTTPGVQTSSGLVITRNLNDGSETGYLKITGISNGNLFKNNGSTAITDGTFITFAEGNAGLKFTPTGGGNGSFILQASSSNADAGLAGATVNASITVGTAVADITTNEDTLSAAITVTRGDSSLTYLKISNITGGVLYSDAAMSASITNNSFVAAAGATTNLYFLPSSDRTASASFTVQGASAANDAALLLNTATSTITITAQNDNPVSAGFADFAATEQSFSSFVLGGFTVSDVDATHFNNAVLTVSQDSYLSGEWLSIASVGSVAYDATSSIVTYNGTQVALAALVNITGNGNGDLQITFDSNATASIVQEVAQKVVYWTTDDNPTNYGANPTRTVTIAFNDGGNSGAGGVKSASDGTETLTVNPVNDNPLLSAGGSLGYNENDTPAVIDNSITLSDVDDTHIAGATVRISSGFSSGDSLDFSTQNGITGSFNSSTGILTLSGSATLANYQTALRSVTFSSSSEDPTASSSSRTISWEVTDANASATSAASSTAVTSTVTITASADQPIMTAGATQSYTENGNAAVIDNTLTISDADDTQLSGATVTLSSGYSAGDTLGFTAQNGISIASNSNGVLTLSGTASLAHYQTALRSVTFSSSSDDPTASASSRTVTWVVTDANSDSTSAQNSTGVTSTLNLTAAADQPVVTAGGTLAYTENGVAVAIDNTINITDVDDSQISGASVRISSGLSSGDSLALTSQNGISGSFDSTTGILTLSGTASLAHYQTALRSVLFSSSSDDPTASSSSRSITWIVTDGNSDGAGAESSTGVTSTITLTALADQPVASAGGTQSYTENGAAVVIDNTILLSDVDDSQLAGATVCISAGLSTGDILGFDNQNGITGSFNSSSGVLTLSGTASIANYQTALRSVTYSSSSDDPTANSSSRTIDWQVTDANSDNSSPQNSTTVSSTLNLTATADAPVMTAGSTLTYTEGDGATAIDGTLTISDADDSQISAATVTITAGLSSGDSLAVATQNGISGSFDSTTGVLTLSGTATLAHYQTALRSVTFGNSSASPSLLSTTRTVAWSVTDANSDGVGSQSSVAVNSAVTLLPVNDLPSFSKGADQEVNEDAGTQTVANWATALDKGAADEANQHLSFLVSNDNNSLFSVQPGIDASGQLSYIPAANANGVATVTVQIHDDGGTAHGGIDTSTAQTFTINVHAVNDAPSFVKGADQVVIQTPNPITVANWATAIHAGPSDESAQNWQFIVSNNHNEMFSVQPAIDANGTLRYTPSQLNYGTATVTVKLQDSGGTARNGVDNSSEQSFTLTVKRLPPPQPAPPPPPPPSDKSNSPASSSNGQQPVQTFNPSSALPTMGDSSVAPLVTIANPNPTPTVIKGDNSTSRAPSSSVQKSLLSSNQNSTVAPPPPVPPAPPQAPPPAALSSKAASAPVFSDASNLTASTSGAFAVVVSSSAGENSGLSLNRGIQDVAVGESGSIRISIPADAFKHSDAKAQVSLSASQADGGSLPNWLSFDPASGRFEGTPPPGSNAEISVKVVAHDNQGKEAVSIFRIKIGKKEGDIKGDTGSQDKQEGTTPKDGPRSDSGEESAFWAMLQPLLSGKGETGKILAEGKGGLTRQLAWTGRQGWQARTIALTAAAERLQARRHSS
ncbi:DUF4347 domain-containing protein [Candidatus Magnetaquicoccus inordinatus]|uniref:DUF4347 domain-containing protein n=1 Tax=Candidatus Magnetaquicoccus inordinatus TaxID=2496818 RepID=UPI00187D56BA|nr:DUF4347 domain-containing protein [Candidatus Magnetaquicoccus inordinatus]